MCYGVVVDAHVLSGHTGITRHSPRDGFCLYVVSPVIGFLATVTCGTDRKLDTSTEVSGPHDFASASGTLVRSAIRVHRIPVPHW